jgi:acetyl esterase/lipase
MIRYALVAFAAVLSACASHEGRVVTQEAKPSAAVNVVIVRDVAYTPADWPQALAADLYQPQGAGPFPAVVMIHGGGWKTRTRADMNRLAQAVAARGYVVMNVSYRFAPRWHFPAQLQDVQQAVLWLRANAAAQNVRTERIGAWGYSAGGHLAALVGATGPGDKLFVDGARVQAIVAGGTPVDLRYYSDGPLTNGLMGVPYEQNPEAWREASPLALVTRDDPPVFLYHGTFDFTVGVKNARALYAALNAAKIPAELYLIRGLEHFSTFFLGAPIEHGIEFLDMHLR